MAGYVPLFDSLTTGTLYGKWPDIGLWPIVLAMADRHGVLDVTPEYLSGVTGLPLQDVIDCMNRFCQPDPRSRTKDFDGARLRLIEDGRSWGWIVVNHRKYSEKARLMNWEQKRKEATRSPTQSHAIPRSDTRTHENPLSSSSSSSSKSKKARGTRKAPSEFKPDREFALAELPDLDFDREAAKFLDFEFKTPHSDWPATWRTWIRTAKDRGQYSRIATPKADNPYARYTRVT